MNEQPPSPLARDPDGALFVHSVFNTIQGEGPFAGSPAVFVRLYGCNLQCPGCDTDYTSAREHLSANELNRRVLKFRRDRDLARYSEPPLVVITGGEPLRQNIGPFVTLLADEGYRVQIETNGSYGLMEQVGLMALPTIVCSPKTPKISKELLPHITAYKYVVSATSVNLADGLPYTVLGLGSKRRPVARPHLGSFARVYLQPEDENDPVKNAANLEVAVASCRRFGYTLCLQLHKQLGMP